VGLPAQDDKKQKNAFNTDWNSERIALLRELNTLGTSRWMAAEINSRTGSAFSKSAVLAKLRRTQIEKFITPDCYSNRRRRGPARPKPVDSAPEFLGLTIGELENNRSQCRYPKGDRAPYTFCAQPAAEGSSYCGFHHHLCWVAPQKRNQERKAA
jgi:hypothetical protein